MRGAARADARRVGQTSGGSRDFLKEMLALLSIVSDGLVLKTPCTAASMQALPGDPSLVLHTSASLGDKKVAFMKACSKAIASTLSKPESYVRA
jgi:hypothetical protein